MLAQLTDPRKTTEAQAQQLIKTAKPIYWITSGMHSPETGGPEMLMELAYRLVVEETPFIQKIRNNVITFITPVIEVDGREKQVDTYYFNKKRAAAATPRLPLMYWGKYVAHDNNRDGMGQFLALTQNIDEDVPRVEADGLHDLHEAQTYLYASTGTGPVQRGARSDHRRRVVDARQERSHGDDQARRARRVDLRVLRRLGAELHVLHRPHAQRDRPLLRGAELRPGQLRGAAAGATTTSREWFRPNPPLPSIKWGPRNNTNIQQSAILFALNHVAKNKELYLENYWLKNKRAVEKGKDGPTYGWVIPGGAAPQGRSGRRGQRAAPAGPRGPPRDARVQGRQRRASQPGDYVIRGDQPYRTLADMYFSRAELRAGQPAPVRRHRLDVPVHAQRRRSSRSPTRRSSTQPMTLLTADAKAPGGIEGTGTGHRSSSTPPTTT